MRVIFYQDENFVLKQSLYVCELMSIRTIWLEMNANPFIRITIDYSNYWVVWLGGMGGN